MIIFAKICKSIDYKDFILQNVHPAKKEYFYFQELTSPIMKQDTKTGDSCEQQAYTPACVKVIEIVAQKIICTSFSPYDDGGTY